MYEDVTIRITGKREDVHFVLEKAVESAIYKNKENINCSLNVYVRDNFLSKECFKCFDEANVY